MMSGAGETSRPGASNPATVPLEIVTTRGWTAFRRIQPAPKGVCSSGVAKKRAKAGVRSAKARGKENVAVEDASDVEEPKCQSEHGAEGPAPAPAPAPRPPAKSASARREQYTRSKDVMILILHKKYRRWCPIAELYNGHWYAGQGTVVSSSALRQRYYSVARRGEAEFADEQYDWMRLWDGPELAQPKG
jgi:hypothetical protein